MTVLDHDISLRGFAGSRHAGRGPMAMPPTASELPGLLAKPHDRLLADAGLSRDDLLGPWRSFWREWNRVRQPWNL